MESQEILLKIIDKQQITIAHLTDQLIGIINAQGSMLAQMMGQNSMPIELPEQEEEELPPDLSMTGGSL